MRHTLEHIPNPLEFIHSIACANKYQGKIYIEVPSFDWIISKNAFWDIFYEHCNYFTTRSLNTMFNKAKTGSLFNGQYIYLIGDLKDLKDCFLEREFKFSINRLNFEQELEKYQLMLKNNPDNIVWGAGAKGSTFVNILDPKRLYIKNVIDINPKKQNKFIAKSAHRIVSPNEVDFSNYLSIYIMNGNYYNEIKSSIKKQNLKYIIL